MCQVLLDCHADVQGPIYAGIPSPLSMARKMELAEIFEMLSPDEDGVLDVDSKLYDPGVKQGKDDLEEKYENDSEEPQGSITCDRATKKL